MSNETPITKELISDLQNAIFENVDVHEPMKLYGWLCMVYGDYEANKLVTGLQEYIEKTRGEGKL